MLSAGARARTRCRHRTGAGRPGCTARGWEGASGAPRPPGRPGGRARTAGGGAGGRPPRCSRTTTRTRGEPQCSTGWPMQKGRGWVALLGSKCLAESVVRRVPRAHGLRECGPARAIQQAVRRRGEFRERAAGGAEGIVKEPAADAGGDAAGEIEECARIALQVLVLHVERGVRRGIERQIQSSSLVEVAEDRRCERREGVGLAERLVLVFDEEG